MHKCLFKNDGCSVLESSFQRTPGWRMSFQIMEKDNEGSISTEFPRVHPEANMHALLKLNYPVQLLYKSYVEEFSYPRRTLGYRLQKRASQSKPEIPISCHNLAQNEV